MKTGMMVTEKRQESLIESRWVRVGEINTHYLAGGEGSSLVLIHGGASCAADEWRPNLEPLAQHHRVYAPDLIGFGMTDKPQADYTFDLFYSFFVDFLDALNLEKTSLMGHSLGGGIALRFTLEYSNRVERLILIDSAGLSEDIGLVGKLAIPLFTLKAKLKSDERYLSMVRNLAKSKISFLDRLPEITVPTLIVWGEWDGYLPVKLARMAHSLVNNSQLCIFERCWHAPQRERPEEFNQLILDFLRR
jgi:pimeloyl-ACP methyl ester carboxylesterase